MKRDYSHSTVSRLGKALLATVVALCLLLLATVSVLADAVNISDQAGVLNASQVRSAGSSLGYPVDIYTTNNFAGSKQSFNQHTAGHIDNARKIVIAIDTSNRYLAIAGGRSVPLTNSQYNDAVGAFSSSYANSGYTGATVAALRSLQNSLAASGRGNGGGVTPAPAGGGIFSNFATSTLCCIGLIVLALIAAFAFARRRVAGGFLGRQGNVYNQPYNQPYGQGGYPPNYYGPGQGQGQGGMNPWAAGGLGAAAGGLVGYELGRNQGERGGGNQGQGDFGGGAGGNFGGDQGGGFGGGDFGGGAGGGFGGDQGGGFGGGDFGGGGGGDFGGGGGGGSGSF